MIDDKLMTKRLERVLYLTSNRLIQDRIEGISSCIHAREWVIAFEILCDNLYDFELPISKETYDLLEEAGSMLKTKKDYWEDLKPQINLDL